MNGPEHLMYPGQPAVLRADGPLGLPGDPRVPGPTDTGSLAVLDYGHAASVEALVAGLHPSPGLVPALGWFPAAVREAAVGRTVPLDVYRAVPGFDPATEVGVVRADRRWIVISC